MEELQQYAPGLDPYLVAIAFVLTYAVKAMLKEQLKVKPLSRFTPILPILAGVLGSFMFMAVGNESASQPTSAPVLAAAATVLWKQRLGAGLLNGFYSMGAYQILKRAAVGKEVPGVPAGEKTSQAAIAVLAIVSPEEPSPTPAPVSDKPAPPDAA